MKRIVVTVMISIAMAFGMSINTADAQPRKYHKKHGYAHPRGHAHGHYKKQRPYRYYDGRPTYSRYRTRTVYAPAPRPYVRRVPVPVPPHPGYLPLPPRPRSIPLPPLPPHPHFR